MVRLIKEIMIDDASKSVCCYIVASCEKLYGFWQDIQTHFTRSL